MFMFVYDIVKSLMILATVKEWHRISLPRNSPFFVAVYLYSSAAYAISYIDSVNKHLPVSCIHLTHDTVLCQKYRYN